MIELLYILVSLIALSISLLLLVRNPRSKTNRYYFAYTLSSILWLSGVFLYATPEHLLLHHFRLLFLFASIMTYTLLLFVIDVTGTNLGRVPSFLILILTSAVSVLSILGDQITKSVTRVSETRLILAERGELYVLAVSWMSMIGLLILALMIRKIKISHGLIRQQIIIILYGYSLAYMFAVGSNIILPNITGDSTYNNFAPFSSLLLSIFIGYTIWKKGFLDIRLIVARAVAYLMMLGVLLSVFMILSLTVLDRTLGLNLKAIEQLAIVLIIVASIVSVRVGEKHISKISAKLFYKDSYNAQKEIDALANIAVTRFRIDDLLNDSIGVVQNAIQPESADFILLKSSGEYYRHYTYGQHKAIDENRAVGVLQQQSGQVFLVDEYEARQMHGGEEGISALYSFLKRSGIYMSVKLSIKNENVGFLLLGAKLSGNIYSRHDAQFIATASNELSIAVQNARRFDEIQKFNTTLRREVEEATQELRRSNEKLKALDTAKDEFITMASHQLRTPLTSVKGYLSMVLEGDTGEITNKQRYLLTSAFTSSQRMVYLIGDLLNVSRLQTGKFLIESSVVDLVDMVAGEINQLKETAKSKNLKITFSKPRNFPLVMLDETKTRQVMMNFIDNAIYYTPQGGRIQVTLEANDKKVEFKVIDNGIGVPSSEAKNLFTKFYRAKNARKARPDGTGLGLFMAKKVIIDQGGAVIFHSKEGRGSTFGFTFPMSKVKPTKDQLDHNRTSLADLKHKSQKPVGKANQNKSKPKKK